VKEGWCKDGAMGSPKRCGGCRCEKSGAVNRAAYRDGSTVSPGWGREAGCERLQTRRTWGMPGGHHDDGRVPSKKK